MASGDLKFMALEVDVLTLLALEFCMDFDLMLERERERELFPESEAFVSSRTIKNVAT